MNVASTTCSFLLAQANVAGPHETYLQSIFRSAGPGACLLILSSGLAIFIGACFVAAKCRRPSSIAAYLILLPLPLVLAIYGALEGQMHSLIVVSSRPEAQLSTPQIADGVAAALSPLFIAITVVFPSYVLLAIVLILRTAKASKGSPE